MPDLNLQHLLSETLDGVKDFFVAGNPTTKPRPVTDDDLKNAYRQQDSFTDKLPWIDLVGEHGDYVLLEDARSVGGVLDLTPIAAEARSLDFLVTTRDAIQRFITDSFTAYQPNDCPWVVSLYARNDAIEFKKLPDRVWQYVHKIFEQRSVEIPDFTRHYLDEIFIPHIEDMACEQGLFVDELTDEPWGGSRRTLRLVVYRRRAKLGKYRHSPEQELKQTLAKVQQNLRSAGIISRRLSGTEIRAWLASWLNPAPKAFGRSTENLLAALPELDMNDLPYDWSLADDVTSRDVRSDKEASTWCFDGLPHTVLTVERLRNRPDIGQTSAERTLGEGAARSRSVCMLDQLPPGSTLILTWVPTSQTTINRHLDHIEKNARGETAEAQAAQESAAHARAAMIHGNPLYPYTMAIALKADSPEQLDDHTLSTDTVLTANSLQLIDPEYDNYRLDSYIRHLPMAHDPRLDQVKRRTRLIYTQHLANLVPLYGRGRGTPNPGIVFYNRGGEPFLFDPLTLADRSKNAHLFLFGPTGAGKSATLNYLLMHYCAIYRPRIVIVEAGNSFGLLTRYFARHGLKTSDLVLRPGCGASLPPFKDSHQVVNTDQTATEPPSQDYDEDEVLDQRDFLGEMLLKAKLMITGGRPREEDRFTRSDEGLLKDALLDAATADSDHPMTVDTLLTTLRKMAADSTGQRADRLQEMIQAMSLFTQGFEGELFNQPTSSLAEDADVIRVEMGTLAGSGYEDKLALAYIGVINEIMSIAEKNQRDGRPTILLTDEGHAITTNPITAAYKVLISKLSGRRLGMWLWDATQNMDDYPDAAAKMLTMFEWWLLLYVGKSELDAVRRFKPLSPDEENMVLSTRKQPGKYTEGCVLADTVTGLFRNVPPALCLALAQTEKEEKTARAKEMEKQQVSELDAAVLIGDQIAASRRKGRG